MLAVVLLGAIRLNVAAPSNDGRSAQVKLIDIYDNKLECLSF
jgi:hypothetical protein